MPPAVAELTIAFALMLIRGVPAAARYLTGGGQLAESTYEGSQFLGAEAAGLTLGLVGLGNVGREVAARARALGFRMLGYDPVRPAVIPPGVAMVSLDELLTRSRLISLHARATPGNRHLLGTDAFARMPRGAYFINTARESLVNEEALAARWPAAAWPGPRWTWWNAARPGTGTRCSTCPTSSSPRTSAARPARRCAAARRWPRRRWPGWLPARSRSTW